MSWIIDLQDMTMPDAPTSRPPADLPDPVLREAPHRIGTVALVVRDLERVARCYEEVVGFAVRHREEGLLRLGTADRVLLELRHDPSARLWSRREAGLFHTAVLLPSRAALGAWLRHMAERRFPIDGASDHIVSEAIYLTDPEGNGVEVYADRPSRSWTFTQGTVSMSTERLDLEAVMAAAAEPWTGLPAGSSIGHVHLQAGELSRAAGFYEALLGFGITARYPGALFFGSGGYHHQLATNLWNSRGAAARTDVTTGLAEVELVVKGEPLLGAIRARLETAGLWDAARPGDGLVRDPWGTAFRLVAEA